MIYLCTLLIFCHFHLIMKAIMKTYEIHFTEKMRDRILESPLELDALCSEQFWGH